MRILFIKLKNIGDVLIATPAIAAARELYPDARIDILVRPGTDRILKGARGLIDNVYTTPAKRKGFAKLAEFVQNMKLCAKLQATKYDWAIELSDNDRGRLMAWMSAAKNRIAHSLHKFKASFRAFFNHLSEFEYYGVHRCVKDTELVREALGYRGGTLPMVWDPAAADTSWVDGHFLKGESPIVLNPYSGMHHKEWSPERWVALAKKLLEFAPVVFSCGPDPKEIAGVKAMVESVGDARVSYAEEGLRWDALAGVLLRARLFVTVDTGALHLAAACRTPTVALFGPTPEAEWGPWQTPHEIVTPPGPLPEDIHDRKMEYITPDAVLDACRKMLG